jgi:hypothetical protein
MDENAAKNRYHVDKDERRGEASSQKTRKEKRYKKQKKKERTGN